MAAAAAAAAAQRRAAAAAAAVGGGGSETSGGGGVRRSLGMGYAGQRRSTDCAAAGVLVAARDPQSRQFFFLLGRQATRASSSSSSSAAASSGAKGGGKKDKKGSAKKDKAEGGGSGSGSGPTAGAGEALTGALCHAHGWNDELKRRKGGGKDLPTEPPYAAGAAACAAREYAEEFLECVGSEEVVRAALADGALRPDTSDEEEEAEEAEEDAAEGEGSDKDEDGGAKAAKKAESAPVPWRRRQRRPGAATRSRPRPRASVQVFPADGPNVAAFLVFVGELGPAGRRAVCGRFARAARDPTLSRCEREVAGLVWVRGADLAAAYREGGDGKHVLVETPFAAAAGAAAGHDDSDFRVAAPDEATPPPSATQKMRLRSWLHGHFTGIFNPRPIDIPDQGPGTALLRRLCDDTQPQLEGDEFPLADLSRF